MIRTATLDDMPRMLELGEAFHTASGQPFGFDHAATEQFLANVTSNGTVLIHDHGMIGGVLVPAYCDPSWIMAVEMFWWADRHGISLLKAFETWAANEGAQEVRMTSLASLDRADRLLKAKGYAPAEISYRKVM